MIEEVKAIAEFITLSDGSQVSASKFLDSFLFPPEKQYTFINKLSGGEKKRLQLLKLLVTNPNFLVLDEPTNDFDIDTLNVLEDFLEKFSGCLLLVSHDRYFMDHLVDQLFVFEGNGKIRLFNGNYSDYRVWVEENDALKETKSAESKSKEPAMVVEGKRKASYKEAQEYKQLQNDIEALEKEKAELMNHFSAGSGDHQKIIEWSERIKMVDREIDSKTARWMELDELFQ